MRNRRVPASSLLLSLSIAAALTGTSARAQQTCTVDLSVPSAVGALIPVNHFDSAGGPGVVRLTASMPSCAWTITSDAAWLTIPGPTTGTGSAFVQYEVAPLPPGPERGRGAALRVGSRSSDV